MKIGSNCWFGVNCVVTSGVTVGDRCVIGANSVVTRDLPSGSIAAGAPANCDQFVIFFFFLKKKKKKKKKKSHKTANKRAYNSALTGRDPRA